MDEYNKLKRIILRILRQNDIDIHQNVYNIEFEDDFNNQIKYVLNDNEIRTIYDKVKLFDSKDLDCYNEGVFETVVGFSKFIYFKKNLPLTTIDNTNKITYTIDVPSFEYIVFLLLKYINSYTEDDYLINIFDTFRLLRIDQASSWSETVCKSFNYFTLKISTDKFTKIDKFEDLKTAYLFNYMYKYNAGLVNYSNINELFPKRSFYLRKKEVDYDVLPLRIYRNELIDYYKLAIISEDSFIKYISYYHIIEFYYDEIFKEGIVNDIRNKISSPDFSYKNSNKIYDLVKFINKKMAFNNEIGEGNEKSSLIYVLRKFVSLDELKIKLDELDKDLYIYYENNDVSFCEQKRLIGMTRIISTSI